MHSQPSGTVSINSLMYTRGLLLHTSLRVTGPLGGEAHSQAGDSLFHLGMPLLRADSQEGSANLQVQSRGQIFLK